MDNQFDILIRFITELVGEDAAKATADNTGKLKDKVDEANKSLKKELDLLKEMKAEFTVLKDKINIYGKTTEQGEKFTKQLKVLNIEIDGQKAVVDEARQAHKKLTEQLQDEESAQSAIIRNLRTQADIESRRASQARRTADRLQNFGNVASVAGVAIGGGIIAEATRYAQKMGDATRGTAEFNAELSKIAAARGRIDAVLVAEVTPILSMASKVANIVAGIVEDNPQLISLALKGAALLVSAGTLAKIASSGIRMYADLTFEAAQALGLKAAEMQLLASKNQLTAAGIKSGGAVGGAAGGIGVGGAALLISAPILGAMIAKTIGNKIQEALGKPLSSWGDIGITAAQSAQLPTKLLLVALREAGLISEQTAAKVNKFQNDLWTLGGVFDETGESAANAADGVSAFGDKTQDMIDAFSQMRSDLAASDAKYAADRMKIVDDSNAAIQRANVESAKRIRAISADINKINVDSAKARAEIIRKYTESSNEDHRKYEAERASIIRDGGLEIQRIEQDRLEKLQQLELDHNDRVGELAANRDALGLVLEQRAFERKKAEIDDTTNEEIRQRRQDLAIRLQDLAQSFAAERAQKRTQLIQDLKDNAEKRAIELKEKQAQLIEEAKRRSEETMQIRRDAQAKLKELSASHLAEITRIRDAFTARRRDLGVFLNGEQEQIRRQQAAILADLQAFLARERALKGSTVGGRAEGGYVNSELIQTHGVEFVTSASTTRALERLVGGRLNQQNLIAAVARNSQSVMWNDNRRFSGEYTKSMRNENRKSTLEVLGEVFK